MVSDRYIQGSFSAVQLFGRSVFCMEQTEFPDEFFPVYEIKPEVERAQN